MENKAIKLYPKSVLSLYLKLYCKRISTSKKNKMMEGIKSWLSLSKKEKQHFYIKYKECQMSYKIKLANYLKKAQPYMKKKQNVKRSYENNNGNNEPITELNDDTNNKSIILNTSEVHNRSIESKETFLTGNEINTHNTVCEAETLETGSEEFQSNKVEYNMEPVLAEPTPPCIRTARDLFDLLNTNNGLNETWSSLPNTQKGRYRTAVQLLKNDYITKYKTYLESLPCRNLFEHYNNFFD